MVGINIIRRALEEPIRIIASNAGHEPSVVVDKVRNQADERIGFDARKEEYSDLMKAGVVDPTKVTRTALQNAASIAGLLLTTEAMISELPEEKQNNNQSQAGGGHPGMMPGMY